MNFQAAVYRWHSGGVYSLQKTFFQRYSSYLNIKEIVENIPQSRTKNIQKVMFSLLKASVFEALKLDKNEKIKKDDEFKRTGSDFLNKAGISLKLKYWWRYIKSNI
ncbi:hypothetical protein D3C85_1515580 [compost metagenome]